jgi:MtN3 and saliva related transmembrane protein
MALVFAENSAGFTQAVGLIAGTITTASFLPQLFRVYRTKCATDLSWPYLLMFTIGISFWLAYGLLTHDLPVILANSFTLVLVFAIMALKWKYRG